MADKTTARQMLDKACQVNESNLTCELRDIAREVNELRIRVGLLTKEEKELLQFVGMAQRVTRQLGKLI